VISPDEAVQIAKELGLTLPDARALMLLSDDLRHARRLAERFADPTLLETRVVRS